MKIQPVILAGGTGSRLWPLSRELYPKQLLSLTDDISLLQTTVKRVAQLENVLAPLIVVGEEHRFTTRTQIEELGIVEKFNILLEPQGRNTAPAICGAAAYCKENGLGDAVLLVLPADHLIRKEAAFQKAVQEAAKLAEQGRIVTFGIAPQFPETGYGYIEKGEGYCVASFKEKPDLAVAQEYVASGNYYWNAGMFAFSVETFWREMEVCAKDMLLHMHEAVVQGSRDEQFFRFEKHHMLPCPSDSIDYVLMEKTKLAAVVPADLGWSDIGSWQALWQVLDKDEKGNVSQGDVFLADTTDSLVRSENNFVAVVGMSDVMVVETSDALLVAPLSRSQDVKKVVTYLKDNKRKEYSSHRTVFRPWGSYTVLEEQERYQIKRITVKPSAKLSLQMHHHRYEHWIVVKGTALVTNGKKKILLHENQSTYIPLGEMHRLENPGVIELELIEVQIGPYLGEDDIVRFDDVYGRQKD